jgi:hypothetical protein
MGAGNLSNCPSSEPYAMSSRPDIAVIGNGVVGQRVVKRLDLAGPSRRTVLLDTREDDVATSGLLDDVGVAVLALPGDHHDLAVELIDRSVHVVSIGDDVADVAALVAEAGRAEQQGVSLVVGAGMSPGLSGLIARHLASQLATFDEIHIALHGTAGPACARQHHKVLAGTAVAFDDGEFVRARAGTGREISWFPEPVGAYDCYRAELPAAAVLHEVFPEVSRITARMSANRRDRFTSRLPMLAPPHHEGGVGAIRVEVRGATEDGARVTLVAGIAEMVGTASAATAAAYAEALTDGSISDGVTLPGDANVDTVGLLRTIERFGVRLQEFTGVPSA